MTKLVFTLIGVIVGGIVSGAFVGMSCAKTYKKQIEDLEADNEYLRDQLHSQKKKDIQEREAKAWEDEVEVDASLMTQLAMAKEEKRKTAEMVKKHGYSVDEEDEDENDYDIDEDVEFDDPFDEGESIVVKKPIEPKKPMFSMMSQEDYEQDFEYRDAENLTYYQEDHVLADSFDDRIGNAVEIVGEEALREAEETNEDFIYVLDEVEDKMYEIEINHEESYYRDTVRGGVV